MKRQRTLCKYHKIDKELDTEEEEKSLDKTITKYLTKNKVE